MDELGRKSNDGIDKQTLHDVKKPLGLLEHILKQTRTVPISQRVCNSKLENLMDEETKVQNQTKLMFLGDKKVCDVETAKEMVDFIMNKKLMISNRVDFLKSLIKLCLENDNLFECVMSGSLLTFCESLLSIYCDPTSQDTEELRMLIPLLSLISNYKEARTVFTRHSGFVYHLMRACVTCVAVFLSKSKELLKITRNKKLAGRVRKAEKEGSVKILTNALGIADFPANDFQTTNEDDLPIECFWLSLFDTTSNVSEKDINHHLSSMQVPHLPVQNFDSEFLVSICSKLYCHKASREREEEWTDVVVAHVLPFGEIIAYKKEDWKHWLNLINGELIEFLRFEKREVNRKSNIKIGTAIGFWTADVKFKWKPLIMTQCLRGIILGRASNSSLGGGDISWAIWAFDIGTLVFCNKVWPLKSKLRSLAPLTCLCYLNAEKTDNGKEEKSFLLLALPLLNQLLSNKPSAAMHMVAYGAGNFEMGFAGLPDNETVCEGGAFLMLIEHPDSAIRIEFLKLILSLTRNSIEVLSYLRDCQFYLSLSSRLEMCVHFCNTVDPSFWLEIRLLIMVLIAIADGSDKNMSELPGWNCMQRVLIMLTEIDNHPQVKFIAAKCLGVLENNKISKSRPDPILNQVAFGRSIAKNKLPEWPSDFRDAPLSDKAKKDSKMTESKPKNGLSSDVKTREAILAEPDYSEPLLLVMDVGESSDDDDDELPSVNAVFDAVNSVDYYTKGCQANFSNDDTHELSQEKTPHQISENNLAKAVCGFLNNGVGGSVYFGINSKGTIEGLKMTRIERDNFRKGIDRMMSRSLFPEVRAACYDINYVPVLNPGEKGKALASHKNWIAELHIKALPHVIYIMTSNRKCYVRQGTECIEGMSILMRQEAAEQNKKEINRAIQEVKAKIPQTIEKLVVFIQDYINRTQPE